MYTDAGAPCPEAQITQIGLIALIWFGLPRESASDPHLLDYMATICAFGMNQCNQRFSSANLS